MNAVVAGLCVAAITFASGVCGLILQRTLPEKFTAGALRDMTGAIAGLLTLLTALVLGLLVGTAYGVYSAQASAVRSLAAEVLELDIAFADYGADAESGRAKLRQNVAQTLQEVWGSEGDEDFVSHNLDETIANLRARQAYLHSLHPTTEEQKQALAGANQAAASISRTRLQMALALTDPLSRPLIVVVVAWAAFIFIGFGMMHASNLASLAAMAVGAIAVSTAVYLVIDLSQPYSGLFRVSSAPIEEVLAELGKRT